MNKKEILQILKIAANFIPVKENGKWYANGAINLCDECENMSSYDYSYHHYPKMRDLLESLPWEGFVKSPYYPKPGEYPTEEGEYITMLDCNEHEVLINRFSKNSVGELHWALYNRTHIKWWMKLPDLDND